MVVLDPTPEIQAKYEPLFSVVYVVTLKAHSLTTEIHVTNPSTSVTLTHQALLHNYIKADSATVAISPLQGLQYIDKVNDGALKTETRDKVDVTSFTDSVYKNIHGKVMVRWSGGGLDVETSGFRDVVVWNPQKEAGSKLADMEDGGWLVHLTRRLCPSFNGLIADLHTGSDMFALSLGLHHLGMKSTR